MVVGFRNTYPLDQRAIISFSPPRTRPTLTQADSLIWSNCRPFPEAALGVQASGAEFVFARIGAGKGPDQRSENLPIFGTVIEVVRQWVPPSSEAKLALPQP